MRRAIWTMAAAALLSGVALNAPIATAQTVEVGPGGVGVDLRSPRQRDRDVQREESRRDRDYDRRRAYRDGDRSASGSTRPYERDAYGERRTRY